MPVTIQLNISGTSQDVTFGVGVKPSNANEFEWRLAREVEHALRLVTAACVEIANEDLEDFAGNSTVEALQAALKLDGDAASIHTEHN